MEKETLEDKLEKVYESIPEKMFDFVLIFLVRRECFYKKVEAYKGIEVKFFELLSDEVVLMRKCDLYYK